MAPKIAINERINNFIKSADGKEQTEMELPFFERFVLPIYTGVSNLYKKLTPGFKVDQLEERLESAGMNLKFTPESWTFRQVLVDVVVIVALFGFYVLAGKLSLLLLLVVSILFILINKVLFSFVIKSETKKRQGEILKGLPYSLDLMTLCVEAGLSFSEAIIVVVSNTEGSLKDEFAKALKEIKMGLTKKAALTNMAKRSKVKELTNLVVAITQADELGISLGKIMRIESDSLRERMREMFRERAMKVPVKMLFPMVFFIFPSIFVVLLGPAFVKVMEVLG
jgi:tight adherence protein C